MKRRRNSPCPCHSGRKAKGCCAPILTGGPADSPLALMRSRYAAYATGSVRHIIATTHPDSPHHQADTTAWMASIQKFCDTMEFLGLEIHTHSETRDTGCVHFTARLEADGSDRSFSEHSRFQRIAGRWLYLAAEGESVEPMGSQASQGSLVATPSTIKQ
jgi:SEC-C motif-containing protein